MFEQGPLKRFRDRMGDNYRFKKLIGGAVLSQWMIINDKNGKSVIVIFEKREGGCYEIYLQTPSLNIPEDARLLKKKLA